VVARSRKKGLMEVGREKITSEKNKKVGWAKTNAARAGWLLLHIEETCIQRGIDRLKKTKRQIGNAGAKKKLLPNRVG